MGQNRRKRRNVHNNYAFKDYKCSFMPDGILSALVTLEASSQKRFDPDVTGPFLHFSRK